MNVEMSSRDMLHVIFRHPLKLAAVFGACVLAAGTYDLVATPQYAVEAGLLVNFGSSVPLDQQQNQSRASPTEETQQDIINSYKSILQGHDLVTRALAKIGISRIYPDLVRHPPGRMTVEDAAVLAMSKDLFVDNPRSTDLLTLTLINPDPQVGVDMVAALIQGFIDEQGSVISNPQAAFLQREAANAKSELEATQDQLQQFRLKYSVPDVDRALQQVGDQQLALQARLRDAEQTLHGLQMQHQVLAARLEHSINKNVELYSDNDTRYRSLDDANTKLTELKLQESELLRNYAPSSEPVIRIEAQIALVERTRGQYGDQHSSRIGANPVYQDIQTDVTRIEGQIASARAVHDVVASQIAALDATQQKLQQTQGHYLDLQRRYDLADQNYRGYVQSMEKAATDDSLHHESITDVSVVEPPAFNSKPMRPRRMINLLMGIALGVIGGLITAIIAELMDDRVSQPFQLGRKTKVPVMLAIPSVAGRGRPGP